MTETAERQIYQVFEDHNKITDEKLSPEKIIDLVDEIKQISEDDKPINKIRVFMETFNQPIAKSPIIPTREVCNFRIGLILEELIELAEGCGSNVLSDFGLKLYESSEKIRYKVENQREQLQPNKTAIIDAFKDLEYVTYGGELTFGLQEVSEEAFEEVHNSNMSKLCNSYDEAKQTIEKYASEGIEVESTEDNNGKFLILRKSDGKVLKSINYKEANFDRFIHESI